VVHVEVAAGEEEESVDYVDEAVLANARVLVLELGKQEVAEEE
jgi:hypothetical protein